jgi:hypothetical protein
VDEGLSAISFVRSSKSHSRQSKQASKQARTAPGASRPGWVVAIGAASRVFQNVADWLEMRVSAEPEILPRPPCQGCWLALGGILLLFSSRSSAAMQHVVCTWACRYMLQKPWLALSWSALRLSLHVTTPHHRNLIARTCAASRGRGRTGIACRMTERQLSLAQVSEQLHRPVAVVALPGLAGESP